MSERKVLHKYFPPDYDPAKIPRLPKTHNTRVFNLRTMAPFNMRCLTCRCYIYKAKKFNSRMEVAEGVTYLGLRQYRFHIRCPSCCSEIVWRTDLEQGEYLLESGAQQHFEALRTAQEIERKKTEAEEEELANNPMKMLEKRTSASRNEMDLLESLEEVKELNRRQAGMGVVENMLASHAARDGELALEEDSDIEKMVKEAFAAKRFKRLEASDSSDSDTEETASSTSKTTGHSKSSSSSTMTTAQSGTNGPGHQSREDSSMPPPQVPQQVSKVETAPAKNNLIETPHKKLGDYMADKTTSAKVSLKQQLRGIIVKRPSSTSTKQFQSNNHIQDDCVGAKQPRLETNNGCDRNGIETTIKSTGGLLGLAYSDSDESD